MARKTKSDFDELLADIEAEARADGPKAVAELRAFDDYFSAAANDLRQARKAAGLTQKQLAERVGIGQDEISRLENADGDPKFNTLTRVARGMGGFFGFISARASSRRVVASKTATKGKRAKAVRIGRRSSKR